MKRAFTLIEVLVVIAVVAVLLAILMPALSGTREAARSAVCGSSLRQMFAICRAYADDFRGKGPAIGEPYAAIPNWALVIQAVGLGGTSPGELYSTSSILICPTTNAALGGAMVRTYAMNATGHAGAPGDPDNFDDPARQGHINFDRADLIIPPQPLLLDSDIAPIPGPAPPPTRTASMIDFRDPLHAPRVGRFHRVGAARGFNFVAFDGSVSAAVDVPADWVALP